MTNTSIHLDQFLKTCGVATGGQAKLLIQTGQILVNDQVETRRRRQLKPGDHVKLDEKTFVVNDLKKMPEPTPPLQIPHPANQLSCIDIGANLTHKSFRHDFHQVVNAAIAAGVSKMIMTGSCIDSSQQAKVACNKFPQVLFSTAGIHPHEAKSFDENTISQLAQILAEPVVVAVGECGLDFNRDFSPRNEQQDCFQEQLALSSQMQLPLFLHERDAFDVFYSMVKESRDRISKGVVHCFTGTGQELRAYLDLDLHIGITGWICDERRGVHLRELVKIIPADRLMIETDAPYLAPRDLRPRVHRNEPKNLPHILRNVATCRGDAVEALSEQIYRTTCEFFSLNF